MVSLNIDNKDSIHVAFEKISKAIDELSNEVQKVYEVKGIDTSSFATKEDVKNNSDRINEIIKQNQGISSCIGAINDNLKMITESIKNSKEVEGDFYKRFEDVYRQLMIINTSVTIQNDLITNINKKIGI